MAAKTTMKTKGATTAKKPARKPTARTRKTNAKKR